MRLFNAIMLTLVSSGVLGQNTLPDAFAHGNNINDERIKTVQLFREEWNLSYPVMRLNSTDKLALHFDLLGDRPETYYYSFIHCDKDWKPSDIFPDDYIEGFSENPIEDYNASFNTTVSYYHYSLKFPNERVKLKLSGNYVIAVYAPGNPEKPLLTRRFMITEDAAKVTASAHRPLMTKSNNTHQQVEIKVNYAGLNLNDPFRNVYAAVLQNGRWDAALTNLKADLQGNNELSFSSLSDKSIFPGGNEFRYFDVRSIRYLSEFVRKIDFATPYYNIYLQPSDDREFKPYFYRKDFNGKYYIAVQEGRNPETDADYVYVYFTMPSYQEAEGSVYVSGAFNDWKHDRQNLMRYNSTSRQYECAILLKQGWYDYEYAVAENSDEFRRRYEGSHYETENDYQVLIYYRNPRERYDRLVGSAVINTLNRMSD